jgi:serine phosphatase RsbU (regulator of sigma subunit)/predicted ester cyclase
MRFPDHETRVGNEGEAPVSEVEEKNKALARRFLEAQANADLDTLDELLAPDFVDHSLQPDQEPGREGFIRSVAEEPAIFSNVRMNIEDQAAEGDKVITRLTISRTHDRGEFLGLAPTGMEIKTTAIVIDRIVGGRIVEEWNESTGVLEATRQRLEQERIQRERVEQELEVARRIQQTSLPEEVPELEGWEISPFYKAAREVGGDFYDFMELDDGRLGIVVGDATRKGVPAALVMASARSMVRALAQNAESPGDVLRRANDPLVDDIPPNMFVTCFYCTLDPKSGRLLYANAGHDLPYLRRRSGDAEELRARGMPLGLMPGMSYEEKETILEAGEAALLYSDGLVEAHGPHGEMFGFPRLRALMAEHAEEHSLIDSLIQELYSFTGEGWEQEDDITLLALTRSPIRT